MRGAIIFFALCGAVGILACLVVADLAARDFVRLL
jgi:hypothetical protein